MKIPDAKPCSVKPMPPRYGPGATPAEQGGDMVLPPSPVPLGSTEYLPGYLATQIGKIVRAEFILGTTQFMDRTGRLMDVGVNYFILQDLQTHALIVCDLYSVKFVNIYQ